MRIEFSELAWEQYLWLQNYDKKKLQKVNTLIKCISRTPFEGAGQPEQLKHELSGCWSRRIDLKNRLVYMIKEDHCFIVECGTHYSDK